MKKSFYLVALLCLLGNVGYAFDVTKIAEVLKQSSISTEKQTAWQVILDAEVGKMTIKTPKVIRNIDEIKQEQFNLQGDTSPDTLNVLKMLKDEENDYNRKALSFAGFQRALANVYRHNLKPDAIISMFVKVFYEG
ncbi:hypothetical protein [Candidatus Endomicrobiellum devescovinae]|jgi:hypothetical protein|uniref:hypothetical protein n=1 Tax=Candidatus Endomicrobiellum devescovinae TaxID=3242322 RepID=UPI0028302E63|nr:hypothetical protein [Endomicrobium sp.]